MKAEITLPGLYVVESDYLSGVHRTPFKYPKVAAVTLEPGKVSYISPLKNDGYNADELRRLDVEVDEHFLESVAGFVLRHPIKSPGFSG